MQEPRSGRTIRVQASGLGTFKIESIGNLWVSAGLSLALSRKYAFMSEGSNGQSPLVVFVVEDEALIQPLLVDPLEEAGYQVLVASSGSEAIRLLERQETGSIRALITDVKLGPSSPSGWDVARRAREVHPDIPVVYVTGDSASDWSSRGVPNSVLITKPFAPAQIITAVSQLINQSASSPPAAT